MTKQTITYNAMRARIVKRTYPDGSVMYIIQTPTGGEATHNQRGELMGRYVLQKVGGL